MKRTDLEKLKGLKIQGRLKGNPTPRRYGKDSTGQQGNQQAPAGLLARLLQKREGQE